MSLNMGVMAGLTFNGARVILNPHLTDDGVPYEVVRNWKERLFSRPWQPLKKTKTVLPKVPSTQAISCQGYLIMHPEMWKKIGEIL